MLLNLEIFKKIPFVLFQVCALNHDTNLCLKVDIYRTGIEHFLKRLNASSSTSCAVNCDISHYNDSLYYTQI